MAPALQDRRRRRRSWTPVTIDTCTSTVYFGTGSGTPNFYHDLHPGPNPCANSLIAVDLNTGKRWWRRSWRTTSGTTTSPSHRWSTTRRSVARPPDRLGRVEGRRLVRPRRAQWADAAPAGEGDRPRRAAPAASPRPAGDDLFLGARRVNYSPASYDPATNYVFNAAAETAAVLIQDKLTPTQKRRKLIQGDVFLGLQNGNFGTGLESWRDHGSISAINVATGRRVWKFQTPEPERGGVTTTASGPASPAAATVSCARSTGTGVCSGASRQALIAAADALPERRQGVPRDHGRGNADSSNGGVAAELQVFAIGGNQQQSAPPSGFDARVRRGRGAERRRHADGARRRPPRAGSRGGARLSTGGPIAVRLASVRRQHRDRDGKTARRRQARRRCADRRRPLRPRSSRRAPTVASPPPSTSPSRAVTSSGSPTFRGPASAGAAHERGAGGGARRVGRSVAYSRVNDLKALGEERNVVVTGRISTRGGFAPALRQSLHVPAVGPDHGRGREAGGGRHGRHAHGRPRLLDVLGAVGRGRELHILLRRVGQVPGRPGAAQCPGRARLGLVLLGPGPDGQVQAAAKRAHGRPAAGPRRRRHCRPPPRSAAIYQGLLVGASVNGRVLKPVAAEWPDRQGRFRLVLPPSDAREDGAALAEQLPGLRHLPGQARRRRRPEDVAEGLRRASRPAPRTCACPTSDRRLPGVSRAGL